MQSQNKSLLAYLCALTLLFSYVEMILPRVFPFFRLGLANAVILLALDIKFDSFIILAVLKAIAASLMGGTLFTPFFLISLVQSLASALIMKLLYKLLSKKIISIYGISIAGSAVSAVIQIGLAGLYIGEGTFALLGPMLIFNTISGIITAFFCEKSGIKVTVNHFMENPDKMTFHLEESENKNERSRKELQIVLAVILLIGSISIFMIKNLIVLSIMFIVSLAAQRLAKRKIFIMPHISLWLFIFLSALFIPNGKVLFKLWNISLTQGALLVALRKALTLSTVSALSQCAVCLKPGKNSLLGQSFEYFRIMSDNFRKGQGSIIKRITAALNFEISK